MTELSGNRGRRVTMAEIAAVAEVSVPTVSKVLNGRFDVAAETRQRVEDALETSGYPRGRRRHAEAPRVLELVFTELGPYASEIIRGASEAALARGGRVTVNALSDEKGERAWIDNLERGNADGVILAMADLSEGTRLRLRNLATPIVIVDPVGDPSASTRSVGVTNWIGGMRATEHLIELGHRRIGMIGGRTRKLCNQARLDGYRAALEHAGLAIDPDLIAVGNPDHPSALAAARVMLNRPDRPTAIFATSDLHALGVYEAARLHGLRLPDDLSVVGFDDIPMAAWASPPLTTMRQPLAEIASLAVRMLLDPHTADLSHRMELATKLVVRGSTTTPRGDTAAPDRSRQ
jgi:LacI family transcriptional regulator, galactose operon repressor